MEICTHQPPTLLSPAPTCSSVRTCWRSLRRYGCTTGSPSGVLHITLCPSFAIWRAHSLQRGGGGGRGRGGQGPRGGAGRRDERVGKVEIQQRMSPAADSLEPLHGLLGILEHLVKAIQGDLQWSRGGGGQQHSFKNA